MNDFFWIAFACYIAMWGVAGYFLVRAYRVGVKNTLHLVKSWNGEPLKNRKKIARSYAITELLTGISLAVFLAAIPVFAIPMRIWPAFILVIGTTRQLQILRFSRQNEP
jgi:hypothetical protein